jgi:hypothetical protein
MSLLGTGSSGPDGRSDLFHVGDWLAGKNAEKFFFSGLLTAAAGSVKCVTRLKEALAASLGR